MYMSRRDGRLVDCNDAFARMLGYDTPANVMAQNARSLYADPAARDRLLKTLRPGRVLNNLEFEWRRRDGSVVTVLANIAEIKEGAGTLILGVALDMTALKWLEEALRESEKLRSVTQLAVAASHEINNPLAVIVGSLEILKRRLPDDPDVNVKIDRALAASRQITEIIAKMHHITRLELADRWQDITPMLDLRRSGGEPPASGSGPKR
ncbi:MAG: PAS domain-containing protein [Candidatus Rokubacteria bacterium]|nr:PAS domain-containing protein [Candidatus Rokubacteria bacterium]